MNSLNITCARHESIALYVLTINMFYYFLLQFENFYHNHFSGRKLTWLHHLCQGMRNL
jgi:hypothetical protein